MVKKILHLTSLYFYIAVSVVCAGAFAKEVTVYNKSLEKSGDASILPSPLQKSFEIKNMYSDQDMLMAANIEGFETENFFDLKEIGFCKDKVHFNKGWLGIFMEDMEGKGILVKEITKGSPAAEAGIEAGDIITKINNESAIGKDNYNLIQFKKTIEAIGAGGEPMLTITRDGVEMVFKPKLFEKLLKNTTESFPSLTSEVYTQFDERQGSLKNLPQSDRKSGRQNSGRAPLQDGVKMFPYSKRIGGISFIDFIMKNEKYKHTLSATLQRIGEEAYAREGFQSHNEINPFRLSLINYLMLHPFDSYRVGQIIHDKFLSKDYCDQVKLIAELLDLRVNFTNIGSEITHASPTSKEGETGNHYFTPTPGEEKRDVTAESTKILIDREQGQKAAITALSLQEKLQYIIDSLVPCVSLVREAFGNLSQKEIEFLYQNIHRIWLPDERVESRSLSRLLTLSQKTDPAKLFKAASLLLYKLSLCFSLNDLTGNSEQGINAVKKTQQYVDHVNLLPFSLPESIQYVGLGSSSDGDLHSKQKHTGIENSDNRDFAGDILFIQNTDIGKIVVGGTGTSYYYADAAVIFDLGGDDYYFNNAGSSNKNIPVSICIDFSGNDVYNAAGPFAQGTGRFGIGLLMDFFGDDRYLGKEYAQGTCLFGIGLLSDNDGDDFYSGHVLNQGVGFFGAGLLHDHKGNDVYFSRQFAQGVGFTRGMGVLVDFDGNDSYTAGGKYPDFRDPEKSFQSMSQGMGMGIRPEETIVGASGGIGILIDQKGSDRYYGDYFSQGSGYYYSLGFLSDNDGSDRYYAGRYAQGAGIHSAIGLLADTSGDDVYECSFGVSQGCGHDTGIGFLVDKSGNDVYRSRTCSQGIGLEKGIGVLADFYGNDAYYADDSSQGVSSPSKTEEITGIGILADNQGDHDIFSDPINENLLFYRVNGGVILNK